MYTTPLTTVGLAWNVWPVMGGSNHCHTGLRWATFPVPMDVAAALNELCPVSRRYAGQLAVPCACAGVTVDPAQAQTRTDAAASRPTTRAPLSRKRRKRRGRPEPCACASH